MHGPDKISPLQPQCLKKQSNGVSPLQDGLQLFQDGSGPSDVAISTQFSRAFTESLKTKQLKRITFIFLHPIQFCINEHGIHSYSKPLRLFLGRSR